MLTFLFKKRIMLQTPKIILNCAVNYSQKSEEGKINPVFLTKLLDITPTKTKEILDKYPQLLDINKNDMINTFDKLKLLNYTLNDVINRPMILHLNSITIDHRYKILKECGCINLSINILIKFLPVMNRTIENLKFLLIIPDKLNVKNILEKCFLYDNIEIKSTNIQLDNDKIKLRLLRKEILNEYLLKKLNTNTEQLNKLWKVYGNRLQHRNYLAICDNINILKNDLNFTNDKIINNGFLLHAEPDNIKRILNEVPILNNDDIRTFLCKKPKILMISCDSIKKIINLIKHYNIPELAIVKCLDVLTLGPDTVESRLKYLDNIEEFHVLKTNPRILRLVLYQNKAKYRLHYLNEVKLRCVSLDILSCHANKFERFTREGSEMIKGSDVVIFLSNLFKKSNNEIRKHLSRHPNWCHIPVIHLRKCYDFLISKYFSSDDIYDNIHILLYPIKRIDEKISLLQNEETYKHFKLNDVKPFDLANSKMLALCLYLIESEYYFTGDGVWHDDNEINSNIQHVENFNTILPDFLDTSSKSFDDHETISTIALEKSTTTT